MNSELPNEALALVEHNSVIALYVLLGAVVIAILLERICIGLLARFAARKPDGILSAVVQRARGPLALIAPLAGFEVVLPNVDISRRLEVPLEQIIVLAIIASVAWGAVALIGLTDDLVKRSYRIDVDDNLLARQITTRLDILSRTAEIVVFIIAIGTMLMTFPAIRTIGAAILTSAGLAALAAGVAARPMLENLFAGMQIALAQPIRVDDVVVVEGEQGSVKQITSTFVVVRLWDLREMVLPLTYFINKPFQNWTLTTARLVGTATLFVNYATPFDEVRAEYTRILEHSPLWDHGECSLAVVDVTEGAVQLRALMSARNSADLFELRCKVREELIRFLREKLPGSLPKTA